MKLRYIILTSILTGILLLQGCAEVVVGTAASGAYAAYDRRTMGSVIEDQSIEVKALTAYIKESELNQNSHINFTSYNGIVLITGETTTEQYRQQLDNLVRQIDKVRRVHNEVTIAAPSSMLSRSSDTLITAKVKASLAKITDIKGFNLTRVKIVTENGVVYLMGMVTHQESDRVAEEARQVSGVQKVVKVFEYID